MVLLHGHLEGNAIVLDEALPDGAKAEVRLEEPSRPVPAPPEREMDPDLREVLLKGIGVRNEKGELVLPPAIPEKQALLAEWEKSYAEFMSRPSPDAIPKSPNWTRDELYDRD